MGETVVDMSTGSMMVGGVSAYNINVGVTTDFKFTVATPWYQVNNAGVRVGGTINNSATGDSTAPNGFVIGNSVSLSGVTNSNAKTFAKTWNKKYDFEKLKSEIEKSGVNIDYVNSDNWRDVIATANSIVFVNTDDLNIDSSDETGGKLIIVSGDINISSDVTNLSGMFVSFGDININSVGIDSQLVVNGNLYAEGDIKMNRNLSDNNIPAVKVIFEPANLFNLPQGMIKILNNWRTR
jgi:hypothetical protein